MVGGESLESKAAWKCCNIFDFNAQGTRLRDIKLLLIVLDPPESAFAFSVVAKSW